MTMCMLVFFISIAAMQKYAHSQESDLYGTEFYVGLMRNFDGTTENIWLYISTPFPVPVSFTVESYEDVIATGVVTNTNHVNVSIDVALVVSNSGYSERFKGIYVHSTNGGLISVIVINYKLYTIGEYLAYPSEYLPVHQYQYYAVTIDFNTTQVLNSIILVGTDDNTTVTIVPTRSVTIPQDIQDPSSIDVIVNAGIAFTVQLHRMQTFLITAPVDITGTSITSDKPLTVISGHECAYIPSNQPACEQIAEQIPPTVTWGKKFLLTPYQDRPVQYYKIVAAESETTLSYTCDDGTKSTILLTNNGNHAIKNSTNDSYCSLISDKPVLVSQLGPGRTVGGTGDPVISVVPSIEQHTKEIRFSFLNLPSISAHYINIATTTAKEVILLDGKVLPLNWNSITDKNSKVIGYGAHLNMTDLEMNITSSYHVITTASSIAKLSLIVYGFGRSTGYSYSAGLNQMQLVTYYLELSPWYGSILGGTPIQVTGPYYQDGSHISIAFDGGDAVNCTRIDSSKALCVSPRLQKIGPVPVNLYSNGNLLNTDAEATFYSKPIQKDIRVDTDLLDNNLLVNAGTDITLYWDPTSLSEPVPNVIHPLSLLVDIKLHVFYNDNSRGPTVDQVHTLATGVNNTGSISVNLPVISHSSGQTVYSSIISVEAKGNDSHNPNVFDRAQGQPTQWTDVFWISTSTSKSNNFWPDCKLWFMGESILIGNQLLTRVLSDFPCPPTIAQARTVNSGLIEDANTKWITFFHPLADKCFHQRTITSTNEGSGNQCCYSDNGNLIVGPTSGGSIDKVSLVGSGTSNYLSTFVNHLQEDILPYIYCCRGQFTNCYQYYVRRPSDDGTTYNPPPPAVAIGDPHIVTLDLHKYTFNGKGEFILVETKHDSFQLQGRMIETRDAAGDFAGATVFSACVATADNSSTVQFELVDDNNGSISLMVLVDGERVDFDDIRSQEFVNVTVIDSGNNTFSATFTNGAFLQVQEENGFISALTVSLPNSFINRTRGLMGLFNGEKDDDLTPRNSDTPLPLNLSLEQIHKDFGISWIIDDPLDSLFTYRFGEDWSTFYHPSFVPLYNVTFGNSSLEELANEICKNDEFCKYDIAATGRREVGEATYKSVQDFEQLIDLSQPIICNPSCVHGACVNTNTCICGEGYEGDTCNDTVYSQCDQSICSNGGTCQYHAGTHICICLPEFTGTFCDDTVPTETPAPDPTITIGLIVGLISLVIIILATAGIIILIHFCRVIKMNSKPSIYEDIKDSHQMDNYG